MGHPSFVAIDFETADRGQDSACAVALVRVEDLQIVEGRFCLLRPPRKRFVYTHVHGITWEDVAKAPTFGEAWPELSPLLTGAAFLAAHYASFDRDVLHTCCRGAGLRPPELPFTCTVELAHRTWRVYPTKLPDVCAYLGLTLDHHQASSDAEACARIVMEAARGVERPRPGRSRR